MRVKNNYSSHLGFGDFALMPEKEGDLPDGFDKKHPIVNFYLKKGWLEEVHGTKEPPHNELHEEITESDTLLAAEFGIEVKKVARLKLAELQAKCADLGITFDAGDTKAILFDKITCHLKKCK